MGAHANRAAVLLDLGRAAEALAAAERALALDPTHAPAAYNRATALIALERRGEALVACVAARALLPGNVDLLLHHATLLRATGRLREALACCDEALAREPGHAGAHVQRGHLQSGLGDLEEALASYARALALDPTFPWLLGHRLHARLKLCDWGGLDAAFAQLAQAIDTGQRACEPFVALLAPLSPAQRRRCAEIHVQQHWPNPAPPLAVREAAPRRLRIGYFCADFRDHPTAQLVAGVIESHDRERFEVSGFALDAPPAGDAMRARLRAAFDRFVEGHERSDADLAQHARDLGIDIAIDLGGHTRGARTGVFAQRAAPVQAAWLGYPGSLGAPFIDHLIADAIVLPPHGAAIAATETVVRLPHSYQPNDGRRPIAAHTPTRGELGLPEGAFVFCCFNQPAKIAPDVFALWMRLLQHLPDAVLWLLDAHPAASNALRSHARRHGVDAARLVFAPRMAPAEHLARHRVADLALDTWPYGAHTTASDALWAGVPLLTRRGDDFAGRVGASLLTAVGLPDLVVDSAAAYETLARDLAVDAPRLAAVRERLARQRATHPLFDTAGFTRDLEAAFESMWARRVAGLAPAVSR